MSDLPGSSANCQQMNLSDDSYFDRWIDHKLASRQLEIDVFMWSPSDRPTRYIVASFIDPGRDILALLPCLPSPGFRPPVCCMRVGWSRRRWRHLRLRRYYAAVTRWDLLVDSCCHRFPNNFARFASSSSWSLCSVTVSCTLCNQIAVGGTRCPLLGATWGKHQATMGQGKSCGSNVRLSLAMPASKAVRHSMHQVLRIFWPWTAASRVTQNWNATRVTCVTISARILMVNSKCVHANHRTLTRGLTHFL